MKKKLILQMLVCCLMVFSLVFFAGCGSDDSETPSVKSIDINISIDFPAKAKLPDLKTLPFRVEEETSVLQAVELYGNVNDMSILVDTTYSTLAGIDGVINDVTLKSGVWKYKINGEEKKQDIDKTILKNGDHLEFVYEKEPQ